MMFQCMFAIITRLMIGAFAREDKVFRILHIHVLWATLVYDPIAHWVGETAVAQEHGGA